MESDDLKHHSEEPHGFVAVLDVMRDVFAALAIFCGSFLIVAALLSLGGA